MIGSLCRLAGLLALALALPACSVLPVQPATAAPGAVASKEEREPDPKTEAAADTDDLDGTFRDRLNLDLRLGLSDLGNFWDLPGLGRLALGVGMVAPMANTTADQHFRDWYQRHVHGGTLDSFAEVFKYSGQLWLVAPAGMEVAGMMGMAGEDYHHDGGLFAWGNR